jgi:DNA-binding CsgD family transcriptional regulator
VALLERDDELEAIDRVLERGGTLLVEGGAGIGKSSLLAATLERARRRGCQTLVAAGSDLEAGFPYGIVRQLFERRLAESAPAEQERLLSGPAVAARKVLLAPVAAPSAFDTSFAVLHGLYWLAANLADRAALVIVVDDVHWADAASRRWLAHLAPRIEGLPLSLVVAGRPAPPLADERSMAVVRQHAAIVRPGLLTGAAVATIVTDELGAAASDDIRNVVAAASGGNPFYVSALVRAARQSRADEGTVLPADLVLAGAEEVAERLVARIRSADRRALAVAQTLAVLGDGSRVRDAALVSGVEVGVALRLASRLVELDVLAGTDPVRFLHPLVREAVYASMADDDRAAAHRRAAAVLFADGAAAGHVGAHALRCRPADDPWVVARLREAAGVALEGGASASAAELLRRAVDEPPSPDERVGVLRELARAEVHAGRESACEWLEEAMALTTSPGLRTEIAIDAAEAYAALFRWLDAVHVIERARADSAGAEPDLGARLDAELVVSALHDARCARLVGPALERLTGGPLTGFPAEARAVAVGMAMVLRAAPADEAGAVLEAGLQEASAIVPNWDVRAALLWSLVTAERYEAVDAALGPLLDQADQSGSTRALVAAYSSLGFLKLRLGALPEADAAARVALAVLQEGDFAPGITFGATILADVAVEAGMFDEAAALLDLLPSEAAPAGVGTVLIPAARGRLELARGHPADALRQFETCAQMFSPAVWGMELRDVGYLHARSGAAHALLRLGRREEAAALARAELDDVRVFGGRRAIGVAARAAGLATGDKEGLELLAESVAVLRASPAVLERAKSLTDLGAALRRAGRRNDARAPLSEALDLAARCGARPLAQRARDELIAMGARPRREHRRGIESLTPSELRVVELARDGLSNREIALRLYVTVKTVEGHLARAYTKLAISGRAALREAMPAKVEGRDPVANATASG